MGNLAQVFLCKTASFSKFDFKVILWYNSLSSFLRRRNIESKRRSVKLFKRQIEESQKIALLTHEKPDTDAIASLAALKKLIETNFSGKTVDIFADADNSSDQLKQFIKEDELNVQRAPIYDLAIGLDAPNSKRFSKFEDIFLNAKTTVQLDHHITNEYFAENNLVYITSSTTEIIYIIAKLMNLEISNGVCKMVYAGMITDTANFTQGSRKKSTIATLNDFYDRKLDLESISEYFFKNNSISKNKLLERAIHSMKFYFGGGLALMKLSKQDFLETGAKPGEEEGIVNQGISTKGVNIACIFIKRDNNLYYVSLRGKAGVNVAKIAEKFGGGGHESMAAFTYQGNLCDIKADFFKECKQELKTCEDTIKSGISFDDEPSLNSDREK